MKCYDSHVKLPAPPSSSNLPVTLHSQLPGYQVIKLLQPVGSIYELSDIGNDVTPVYVQLDCSTKSLNAKTEHL